MLILAIDTCLMRCSVCLFDSEVASILNEEYQDMQRGHAEILAPMVQRVLLVAGRKPSDLQRIVVTIGPGTFTGLRIGLSFARAFGLALGIPVYGLDTLRSFQLSANAPNPIALVSGNSELAYVLTKGQAKIDLLPRHQVENSSFEKGTPDLHLLAQWAAQQPQNNDMPEPIYIREADAKPQIIIKKQVRADALARVHLAAFSPGWSAAEFTAMLEAAGTVAFSAEIMGEVVGIALTRTIADQSELLTIATLPSRRKLGIAAKLLRSASDDAKSNGATNLFLEVAHSNSQAMLLYAKLEFIKTGMRKNYYNNGDDAVLMARSLV